MGIFLDVFGREPNRTPANEEVIRRIAGELDRIEPARARELAAFAYILSRVANADGQVNFDEIGRMEGLVVSKGGISTEQAALVVQMARTHQKLFGGTDDFLVTRELARTASYEQKVALIDCLFAVAAADQRVFVAEGDEIARIGNELKVEQADLSRLRSSYREFIEARKGLSSGG